MTKSRAPKRQLGEEEKRDAYDVAAHNRLALALNDLDEALAYALYLVERKPAERVVVEAFTAAMIVAYGRCFSNEEATKTEALPAVPPRFLKGIDSNQRALHIRLRTLRNEEFAHSDADAASVATIRFVLPNETFVSPTYRPVRSRFSEPEVDRVIELITHLRLGIIQEMARIQYQFKDRGEIPTQHFPDALSEESPS